MKANRDCCAETRSFLTQEIVLVSRLRCRELIDGDDNVPCHPDGSSGQYILVSASGAGGHANGSRGDEACCQNGLKRNISASSDLRQGIVVFSSGVICCLKPS